MGSSHLPGTLSAWNDLLGPHFFGVIPDGPLDPIRRLVVTPAELARATGVPGALPERADASFRRAVCEQARKAGSLLADARDYGSWSPGHVHEQPPFIAHLLATCRAASEVTEEFQDEGSFFERLSKLLDGAPIGPPTHLPKLWEDLARWLAGARRSGYPYRELVLPEVGGLKRVGYSLRLAFPSRTDQFKLASVLADSGLIGLNPPPGEVVRAVGSALSRFSKPFRAEFDEFRLAWDGRNELADRVPFWLAVLDAVLRGEGMDEGSSARARFKLRLKTAETGFAVQILASEGAVLPAGLSLRTHSSAGEGYCYVEVSGGEDRIAAAARRLLAGEVILPRVGTLSRQGVLLFDIDESGRYVLVDEPGSDQMRALVRKDLVETFRRFVVRSAAAQLEVEDSTYPGWCEVHDFGMRVPAPDELRGTPLVGCWSLSPHFVVNRIHPVGGVRLETGFLLTPSLLPAFAVQGAEQVLLEGGGRAALPLRREAPDARMWVLPPGVPPGPHVLVARTAGEVVARREVRFFQSVSSEDYKRPADWAAWGAEGVTGNVTSFESADASPAEATDPADLGADFLPEVRQCFYLGPRVGDVQLQPQPGFDWVAYRLRGGGDWTLEFRGDVATARQPERLVGPAGAARFWRKTFHEAHLVGADSATAQLRETYRRATMPVKNPQRFEAPVDPGLHDRPKESAPHPALYAFESLIAALACRKQGLSESEFHEYVQRLFGLHDYARRWDVMRAWEEVGALDRALYMRFNSRRLFAVRPHLVRFRTGRLWMGTLLGLSTQATRERVTAAAQQLGVYVEPRRSHSSLVPTLLALHTERPEAFEELERRAALGPTRWLRPLDTSLTSLAGATAPNGPGPLNYPLNGTWSPELRHFEVGKQHVGPHGVRVEWFRRMDAPDYYAVRGGELAPFWTYSRNLALLAALQRTGELPFAVDGGVALVRSPSATPVYLPVVVARIVAALGAVAPGPEDGAQATYRYNFPTAQLRARVVQRLGVPVTPCTPAVTAAA